MKDHWIHLIKAITKLADAIADVIVKTIKDKKEE